MTWSQLSLSAAETCQAKDLVKSGGVEHLGGPRGTILGRSKAPEAAVIGVGIPKCQEPPAGLRGGEARRGARHEGILEFLECKVAQVVGPRGHGVPRGDPEDSVGKFSKKELRARSETTSCRLFLVSV